MKHDAEFTCPSLYTAQMNHKYSNPNTANYLFSLNHTIFASAYADANASYLEVSHFSGIPYVFNQAKKQGFAQLASAEDIKLSSEMSCSWASFAAFGDPSQGNGTISDWLVMVNSSSTSKGEYDLQVIGGPGDGIWKIGNAQGSYEDLAIRCAFWISEEVFTELRI
ncbi:hypothetical protein BDW59DRAFT_162757 [Aspergillus cavernicola]|uniref:Carboxylesterase type B domain-containing protein n=1 Tax=Aspergillus cavernicola TaxID=176166 RepID=A0ABR4IAJ6_9EURO